MLFTKKKIVSMSVGVALLGTVAYGGLGSGLNNRNFESESKPT